MKSTTEREGWTYFDRLLAEHGRRKVGNNTYAERRWNEDIQAVLYVITLYDTDIVVLNRTHGTVRLDSGGHRTVLTKRRMNEYLAQFGLGVETKSGDWHVASRTSGGTAYWVEPFEDGMVVDL